ncbi:MAG: SPFH domain-containing protein [Actinomycetota bacterium]|nr:flotillin [Acidimicrobiaceae bacterium]MEC7403588.1 SPFH domain-containing protein [Actinomycetota bacterium]MAL66178.1 flotillin [Acidimicrobiaceae bacterium]MEC7506147.1 SPFH domain-containing protein [Actinomycetota bacterium]MEC7673097.1 SPFH domain-containing protein [Actinomycetota bacterium]
MATALALAIIAVLAVLFVIMIVSSLIVICPPNKVAVISGRTRTLSDGRTVGYRILKGGRTLRIPILEKVSWMDLNTIPLEVSVTNAYSKGAIPLNVQGIANVKVSSAEGLLENAAERFLDRPTEQIGQIAKETLEANLRGVLATLSPEEVNEDRLKFSHQLIDEADDDIKTLGLELDVMKIQNVTDDNQYLDSVGRRLTAEVVKQARVAEAERMAESEAAEAAARERAQIATVQADKNIVEEQNQLRVRTAELEAIAKAKEEEASVAGDIARATAEQELEQQRIELERRRLEADVVTPAKANLEAKQLAAQAEAAKIIEDGKAQVEVFQRLTEQYQAAGDDGQRIFVLNMLPELVDKIVSTVNNVDIDRVAIVDNGGGQGGGIPGLVSQLPGAVVSLTEQIEAATGVDILGSMRSDQAELEPDSELPPPPPAPEA